MNVYILEKLVMPGVWELVTAHISKTAADTAMETTKMVFKRISEQNILPDAARLLKTAMFRVREILVQG